MVLIVAAVVAEVLSYYTEIHPATETPVCVCEMSTSTISVHVASCNCNLTTTVDMHVLLNTVVFRLVEAKRRLSFLQPD